MARRKKFTNIALKLAIVGSGQTQRLVASKTRISEMRLTSIVTGRTDATEHEMDKLSRLLRRPIAVLFPGPRWRKGRAA